MENRKNYLCGWGKNQECDEWCGKSFYNGKDYEMEIEMFRRYK